MVMESVLVGKSKGDRDIGVVFHIGELPGGTMGKVGRGHRLAARGWRWKTCEVVDRVRSDDGHGRIVRRDEAFLDSLLDCRLPGFLLIRSAWGIRS